jgi:hypothetical protein
MTRPELNDDFIDVLATFDEHGVDFVVVGAHALAAHGIVRATGDIGLFVRPSADNARRVFAALVAFGAPIVAHGISVADFEASDNVYQIGLPPRRIDVLTSISGVSFDEAWGSRVAVRMGGVDVAVLGREAMIRNKRSAARPKDLVDADSLERTRPPARSP